MADISGRRAVITGASSGLGAALAAELARRGAAVGLVARRQERLEEHAATIRAAGGTAAWQVADVTDRQGLHGALDRLETELGGADVAVANAGFNRFEQPHRFEPGRALAIYDANLLGALHVVDWALPRFLERRAGHLVAIASLAGYFGFPGSAAYCGSKAAIRLHFQSLRLSLASYGIAVTTICPGFVETELTEKNDFRMPFLWPVEKAARRMADDIEARRGEVAFPWQLRLALGALTRLVPTRIAEALVRRAAPHR
jgi:short-subunit dehydrogenase